MRGNGHGRGRKLILICVVVLAIAVGAGVARHIRRADSERRLLDAVGVPADMPYRSEGYVDWTDPLGYVSGYEILAAGVDPDSWHTPAGWHTEAAGIDEIGQARNVTFITEWFAEKHIALPERFDAWTFSETGRGGSEFRDWHFHAGLYGDGTLIVYHGHDLWSDSLRFDTSSGDKGGNCIGSESTWFDALEEDLENAAS